MLYTCGFISTLCLIPGWCSSRERQQTRLHTDSSSSQAKLSEFESKQRKSEVRRLHYDSITCSYASNMLTKGFFNFYLPVASCLQTLPGSATKEPCSSHEQWSNVGRQWGQRGTLQHCLTSTVLPRDKMTNITSNQTQTCKVTNRSASFWFCGCFLQKSTEDIKCMDDARGN